MKKFMIRIGFILLYSIFILGLSFNVIKSIIHYDIFSSTIALAALIAGSFAFYHSFINTQFSNQETEQEEYLQDIGFFQCEEGGIELAKKIKTSYYDGWGMFAKFTNIDLANQFYQSYLLQLKLKYPKIRTREIIKRIKFMKNKDDI